MTRDDDASSWSSLNGLWQWQGFATELDQEEALALGGDLNETCLVPFPVESCLSGVEYGLTFQYMLYRTHFTPPPPLSEQADDDVTILFGAVDWRTKVYVNGVMAGDTHTGGYDGFSFNITGLLNDNEEEDELVVSVYDPSDNGVQPNGKQRISAITDPSGDTYTPSSGIWQTVWLERVPRERFHDIKLLADLETVTVWAECPEGATFSAKISDDESAIVAASDDGVCNDEEGLTIAIPNPKLWSPDSPHLYDLDLQLLEVDSGDAVRSYFGMRTISLADVVRNETSTVKQPVLNGEPIFMAGWLDQSWWPDGQYTAPTDEALLFDIESVKRFGLNMVRLHQKVNNERWYYHADRLGVLVWQDMPQKYGGASNETIPLFDSDLRAMIHGRFNHPSIVQWDIWNEGDCVGVFNNVSDYVSLVRSLDPSRLVNTNSGGPANDLHLGDVNDIHDYPDPQDPLPSATQFAAIGEFGGLGAFIDGKEWVPGQCSTYEAVDTPEDECAAYIVMAETIQARKDDVSASVYTQITDLERECDGFLNYDRTNKFNDEQTARIAAANTALICA